MKTYIITERKIKLRTQERARCLARFLAQRNNKKYAVYLCTLISEVDTRDDVVYVEGQEIDFEPKYKEALKKIEILKQAIKAKNVEIKTLKSEIDNLKTPLLKKLLAKIKNLNINIK